MDINLSVESVAPFGAFVTGLDISRVLDKSEAASLRRLLNEHQVLVFRGHKSPTDAEYSRFAGNFGPPVLNAPLEMGREGVESFHETIVSRENPEIIMLTNKIVKDGREVGYTGVGAKGLGWHSDYCWADEIAEIGALDALVIPSWGGQTCFANMYAVYESLSPQMQAKLDTLVGHHELHNKVDHYEEGAGPPIRFAEHPLVLTNPYTGRRALYISPLYTTKIIGLPEDESKALLQELFDLALSPRFIHTHEWRVGDMVIYDQLGLIHARMPFNEEESRCMRQISLAVVDKDAPWRSFKAA
jgi:alpha-ketoglutarate-dependent taurine dioxygenase